MIRTYHATINTLHEVAHEFVKQFPEPQTFVVVGEMGAGKTTFIKAICKALEAGGAHSPTYSLVNEYTTAIGIKIFHFDLYRVKSLEEALDFGFEEYLEQGAYVFIEWPAIIIPLLSEYNTIAILDRDGVREIQF